MPLLLAGIDEAGYGPTLGPLAVGLSVFRVAEVDPEAGTPNLWKLLKAGVCREPGRGGKADVKGRIAVADSKQLKLANSVQSTHPLVHLERGVLSFISSLDACDGCPPATDTLLFSSLNASWPAHDCYAGTCVPLPTAHRIDELGIAGSILARALAKAKVDCLTLRCRLMCEREFNGIIRSTGSKAEATATALSEHLRCVWELFLQSPEDTRLGIVCDRQGGRMAYADLLSSALPGATITIVEQTENRSQYFIERDNRRAGIAFLVEGESAHLPVALASMLAKYTRELAMARFNRFWANRCIEIKREPVKPTAGYSQDARRWLEEMRETLTPQDREQLVRIA